MWASNKNTWIVAFVAVAAACTTARGNPIGAKILPSNYFVDSVGESSGKSNSNRPLKAQQVRKMIQQNLDENKHEIVASVLTDEDFKSSVKSEIKNFTKESVKCKAMGEFYYDPEIPDCKSCHRADCDSSELCKVECRDILNYNSMNVVLEGMKATIDRLEGNLNELNHILNRTAAGGRCRRYKETLNASTRFDFIRVGLSEYAVNQAGIQIAPRRLNQGYFVRRKSGHHFRGVFYPRSSR